jgi:STE24 endopeptidase
MGQRFRFFELNQGFMWLLIILGALSLAMLFILLISSITYRPPGDPATLKYFDTGFLATAAQYNQISMVISISIKVLTWLFMAAAVLVFWRFFSGSGNVRIYTAAGYIALFYIILNLVILPLSFYRGYIVEHQFGLSNQSVGLWFADFGKEKAIDMLISVAAFTGLYALMVYIPKYWWLIAASVMALFVVIGVYLYPVLIEPLYFKFKPLQDQELREEILEVTDKAGIEVNDILVVDASRRTVKANAYFTGFGNTRRIVFYDNLLNNFTREETLNVIAHEAAHWRYAHIVKSIAIGISAGFLGLYILSVIIDRTGLRGDFRSIFIIMLLISFITFLTAPAQNALSRHFERQSDQLTLEITEGYDAQVKLLKGLAEANLSNVNPHPVIRALLYSHPPILERIKTAENQE